MTSRGAGLRLRLFASLTGAALIAGALLAVPELLAVRDALYARKVADATLALRTELASCAPPDCLPRVAEADLQWLQRRLMNDDSCPREPRLSRSSAVLCQPLEGELGAIRMRVPLGDVRVQLGALDARLLALLGLGLVGMVVLSVALLERAVVRRLHATHQELAAIGAAAPDDPLAESGDAVSNLEVSVRQLGQRLRDERARTAAQIAELQARNAELRDARARLERSEHLAGVGRLASGVAHEVGNPISAVIAYAALLKERAGDPQSREFIERIEREAARVDRILRDLIDLARPAPEAVLPVALARTVDFARASVASQPAFAAVTIEVALPADLPAVRGDEHYLSQVFVNLFTNAARAGAKAVRVSGGAADGGVAVEVRDDGRGIPDEALPRLFEPFFTTAAPGEGSGLGLALCHATLERFGGSIEAVQPASGPGALFRLRFARA